MTNLSMEINASKCFICGSDKLGLTNYKYTKCNICGHEIRNDRNYESVPIINDILSLEEVKKETSLDKFKRSITIKCKLRDDLLIDIGSASGKYIYRNKNLFKKTLGIEITKECVDFSLNTLGLAIKTSIRDIPKQKISLVTFWHSLEHIPVDEILTIFDEVKKRSTDETSIIISLPNCNSLMNKIFKSNGLYFDFESHIHQFSISSLDRLLNGYGFIRKKIYYSFSYTFWGYLAGFLNLLNPIHNFLYYFKKRGVTFGKSKSILFTLFFYNILLSSLFFFPSIFLAMFDAIFISKEGVLTVCYQRKKNL